MGIGRRISFFSPSVRLSLLFLLTTALLISSANPLSSSSSSSSSSLSANSNKVVIALYYETLCPYCSNLIVNYLYKYFEDGLDSIADLKLIPYGNAKIVGANNTIVCQHGPMECVLNTVESCAIHTWPDVKDHFPFIYCVESLVYDGDYDHWETCFEKLNLDAKPVMDCYSSGYGEKLELQYAAETNALEPRHTYVPWLVVDGQPLYDDYTEFIYYVCKAYKGTDLPKACQSSLSSVREKKVNSKNKVCYPEKTTKTTLSKLVSAVASWIRQDNVIASI